MASAASATSAPSHKEPESNGVPDNACSFKAADTVIQLTQNHKPKPDPNGLVFGTVFTDHMLIIEWSLVEGWQKPHIQPFGNLSIHPACSSLHYAVQLFEGMKAYRGPDNKLRLFRPMLNMKRMLKSAHRACLPSFDGSEFLECIKRLVEVDQDWVPQSDSASLYIRPTFVGTESRWLILQHRSQTSVSVGRLQIHQSLERRNWRLQDGRVLWLYGDDHQITEVGTMNLFLYWINEKGEEELATPPLDGIILPGITRQSILELAYKWGDFLVSERYLTMGDLCQALEENRVKEMFGSGTACVISPVGRILYQGENLNVPCEGNCPPLASRLIKELTDIQYGRTPSDWSFVV
ncbi:branched-chain-amino-acid aminotransferase, cytosolic-like isoform X2 [Myxocyprinus asiaticus]|uniref:branched-chain-amino-acid aminotransferase, cytosolic-like isoform X2 n=1 Tax=Myxocyprinus asiaticus TaxID=70543 RepID=UPI0022230F41|nr:branched-chain-amino-acid aminotransferase, cytosolic-like isoform X2 [Myxocyprinus asiaticus]